MAMRRRLFRYEKRGQRPLPRHHFVGRLIAHFLVALLVVVASLGMGMAGYHHYEHLGWTDAFLNSSMLLGGMGPVNNPQSEAGKVFAGLYALYSGMIFLIAFSIILAPVFHRVLHRFHWEEEGGES